MRTIKTAELTGAALDWAVAKARGAAFSPHRPELLATGVRPRLYCTRWNAAGPIIEREGITLLRDSDDYAPDDCGYTTCQRLPRWVAVHTPGGQQALELDDLCGRPAWWYEEREGVRGPTPLIAAMRCYVASKLGDTVDVPDDLA